MYFLNKYITMQVIFMKNYKKALIFACIIFISCIAFFGLSCFRDKNGCFSNTGVNGCVSYVSYKSADGKFSFMYPSSFLIERKNFLGDEILYHIDFHDKYRVLIGFMQVWNLKDSLEEFLENSKAASRLDYTYFVSKPIIIDKTFGYFWDYVVINSERKYIKGSEVFLEKHNKMYRISYFVPENLWDKRQSEIFNNIIYSLKIY